MIGNFQSKAPSIPIPMISTLNNFLKRMIKKEQNNLFQVIITQNPLILNNFQLAEIEIDTQNYQNKTAQANKKSPNKKSSRTQGTIKIDNSKIPGLISQENETIDKVDKP